MFTSSPITETLWLVVRGARSEVLVALLASSAVGCFPAWRNEGERERGITMSAIELNAKEVTTLVGTDDREWHAELKEQEAILGEILNRLKGEKHVA